MSHTIRDKDKLIARVNRIKGQLDAVSQILNAEEDPYKLLQLLSSSRGALTGMMGDILEGHILEHIVEAPTKKDAAQAGREVTDILKSFWK
ncbi:MAG: metal/formaldehyde-sensitive transcriptional repressor [Bdellovibrionaceae bacterium]|nr:metal/formaldehyde-sensitive transcriptional repressor [Pseudobdellovibrionaceae bacterium]